MQFNRTSSKKRKQLKLEGGRDPDQYPHQLQFYVIPPTDNISLHEFEDFAVERLKVLKAIENCGIKYVKGSDEYKDSVKKELHNLKNQGVMRGLSKKAVSEELSVEEYDERRKDHISHFILRLAYCKSDELRRWFIQEEVDLFRYRFGLETDASISKFLQLNKLDYIPISEDEKQSLMKDLKASTPPSSKLAETEHFYKVPFTEALDLVKGRKVFVSKGYAYVPHCELVVIVLGVFRKNLSHALAVTARAVPHLEEDTRLLPMLNGLSKRYLGQDYTTKKTTTGAVTAAMVDSLCKTSFPLCMQQVHAGLRQQHHLKHWGRMQYGLFLKAIGLNLDEALRFWRAEFTKMMDGDKFDKQYAYNIRHNYGKEGKRADYTPYSCMKIIMSNPPGPGDHHGCPFKHTDADLLKQRLQSQRLSKDAVEDIIESVKGFHFGVACGKYFKHTHNGTEINVSHPNQYYEESQKVLNGENTPNTNQQASQSNRSVVIVKKQKSTQQNSSQNQSKLDDDGFGDDDEDLLLSVSMDETAA